MLTLKLAIAGLCQLHNPAFTYPIARKTSPFRAVMDSAGYENNADVVGALNSLERGHRLLACGDVALRRSVKQEPTEGLKAAA